MHATSSPQAGARTCARNYKDMVLAECIATAYRNEPSAAMDAGSSVSALMDRTDFDLERNRDASKSLVNRFLARDYRNPVVQSESKGAAFDFFEMPGSVSQPGTRDRSQAIRDQPEAQLSTRESLVRPFKVMRTRK